MIDSNLSPKAKDKLWSKAIRKRDRNSCRIGMQGLCTGRATDACHIFSRRFKVLRWDLNNGIAGCRACHTWAEKNSDVFEKLAQQVISAEVWNYLVDILEKEYGIRRERL